MSSKANQIAEQILEQVNHALQVNADQKQSKSLSPSMLNHPCHRHVFYQFRWASNPVTHSPQTLRIFNRGHRDESQLIQWLQQAGIVVQHVDNGNQIGYDEYNGHVKGFVDGILIINDDHYILECKSINVSTFKVIKNDGLKIGKLEHYLQVQLYMYFMKLPKAIYIAVNKNNDELHIEEIDYDEDSIRNTIGLTAQLLFTNEIPPQAHSHPQGYICQRFGGCPHINTCFGVDKPLQTCRSCIHGSPYTESDITKNSWHCKKHNINIPLEEQTTKATSCPDYSRLF